MILRLILVVLALCTSVPAAAQHGERREYFRDFLVACRSDNYCSATTYVNPNPPSGTVADYILRIGRHQDSLDWEISFTGVAMLPRVDTDIAVFVDDERFDFAFPDEVRPFGAINDFFLTGIVADRLLSAMRNGARAEIVFRDETDAPMAANFSLSGLVASMTWIDAQQNRPRAEVRAGALPVGIEPAVTTYLRYDVPDAIWEANYGRPDCLALDELDHGEHIWHFQVAERAFVYVVPCVGGGYNPGYTLTLVEEGVATPLFFAQYDGERGWYGTTILFNVEYEQASGHMTSFVKGRALGDCGATGTWAFEGTVFTMLEFAYEAACDGSSEPGVFPIVFSGTGMNRDAPFATR